MKNKNLSRLPSLFAAALVVTGLLTPATGFARGRSTTVHGVRGGTYQRQINRTPGNFSQTTSVTNAAGQTASRSLAAQVDRAAGSLTASASTTLADGRTASRSFNTHRTDTGRTTAVTAADLNGRTASYNSTSAKTDTGYTRQVNATGPNGATGSKQVTVSTQSGVTTRTVTRESTPPQS